MKNDLICQSTEYDCGPTCVTNAMRYLFEREEIPPVVMKHIWTMGIDTFATGGETGKMGTSKASMRYMACWFGCYSDNCRFPVRSEFLDQEFARVTPGSPAWECLDRGGCAVMRCTTGQIPHYVLLTALLPDGKLGLFDPYAEDDLDPDDAVWEVTDQPKRMNRIVLADRVNWTEPLDYAMGMPDQRELLLFWRTDGEGANHE